MKPLSGLSAFFLLLSLSATAAAIPQPDVAIQPSGTHVVINLPQTRLFLFQDGELKDSFPVAVGKMLTRTPVGEYAVTGIYRNPSWHVPRSIQEEMRKKGKPVETVVPPGPDNPLGPVFIRFGEAKLGLGIHGTNAPSSVPGFRSHGCVRMKSEQALQLSNIVPKGAAVSVTYQTVLLSQDQAGELWLTAFRDRYQNKNVAMPQLADALLRWQDENQTPVFGKRVNQALNERKGKPLCLTCKKPAEARISGTLSAIPWLSNQEPAQILPEPAAEPVMEPAPEEASGAWPAAKRKAVQPATQPG
ncbi:L,D-transpeptidase [Aquitalea sp. S1-19]|nr:L,D-transpeptidase [Aquitalea sp. S1-19]RQW24604.1 L,D-transpeptidase [Rhodobacteraceae bacterium CH30]